MTEKLIGECDVIPNPKLGSPCFVNRVRSPGQEHARTGRGWAHRIVWTEAHGKIPPDNIVHHKCERKRCLNVRHMELLTVSEHSKRHAPWLRYCKKHRRLYDGRGPLGPICLKCRKEHAAKFTEKRRRLREQARKSASASPPS